MSSQFKGLLSTAEAAKLYGLDSSSIRHAIRSGRLVKNVDVKLFGKQWVVTEKAMEREFKKKSSRQMKFKFY